MQHVFGAASEADIKVVEDQGKALSRHRRPGPGEGWRDAHRATVLLRTQPAAFIGSGDDQRRRNSAATSTTTTSLSPATTSAACRRTLRHDHAPHHEDDKRYGQ